MAEDEVFIEDEVLALDDSTDDVVDDLGYTSLVGFVQDRYKRAEDYRELDEDRWSRAYRNYRGLYGSDVQFT